ncbi:MAG: ABC transporter ATP-binding protein [Clostridiales bacterium]|nr:ABC transporter ATP-binding protein [Clostridiales bacterium]
MFKLNSSCNSTLKKSCAIMVIVKLLINILLIIYTITLKNMINTVMLADIKILLPYILIFLVSFIVMIISNRFVLRLERRLKFNNGRMLREEFITVLYKIMPCCKDKYDRNDISHRYIDEINNIVGFYVSTIPDMVREFTFLIFLGIYAMVQNAWLILIFIFVATVVCFFSIRNKRQIDELNSEIVPYDVDRSTIEYDVIAANMELKFYDACDYINQKVLQVEERYIQSSIKLQNKYRFFWGMEILSFITMSALFYSVGSIFAIHGSLTFGVITSLVVLLDSINNTIFLFPNIMLNLYNIKPFIERYNLWLKEERINESPVNHKLSESENIYILENFGYKYRGSREEILSDISIKIKKGKKYFITGKSGCGKSTLLKMLIGYDNLYKGKLQYRNCDISSLKADLINHDVIYMSDDMFLISGTIKEIFLLFYPDIHDEEIQRYLNLVELQFSLDMKIEKDGGNISGGEKQRLLLALSLIKKKSIYLMDECLSMVSLDQQLRIMNRIICSDITCLWIDHRVLPEVLVLFDEILFFDNTILYQGNLETMLKNNSFNSIMHDGN